MIFNEMATKGPLSERKRPARVVKLVLSAIKNLGNDDGCTIGKIVDYVTDIGRRVAPKREVIAALKRGVEFGIMNKRRGRYFLKSAIEPNLTRFGRKVVKKTANRKPRGKGVMARSIARKLRTKKRRVNRVKPRSKLRRLSRKPAIKQLRRSRRLLPTKSYKFFDLYVNPSCRMSAKSSVPSTQILEQEETENCA